ncbi:MAG: RNA polymerase sigma factor [Candidatus Wallbacteria bacterium]|nr:RNA polymerase sigma factor [Candidatus Wallbacteria bacterium]
MEPDIDAQLARVIGGDADGFEAIVRLYQKPLYNFVLNRVRDGDVAEELTQEAFFKAYRSLSGFDAGQSSFKTWLYRIGLNLCLDHFRRRKVRQSEQALAQRDAQLSAAGPTPMERLAERDKLMRLLARIDLEDAEMLLMRFVDDLTYEEIAGVTGLGEATLRSRVHRALRKLQSQAAGVRGVNADAV